MKITANNETFSLDPGTPLPDFLHSLELNPDLVVVERNEEALTPAEIRQTILEDGDRLEIVQIVAGG